MWTQSVDEILDRLKSFKNLKTDTQLAEVLGVKRTVVSNWRHRGNVPSKILLAFCEKEHINPGWLFAGIGAPEGETGHRSKLRAKIDAVAADHPLVNEIIDELLELEEEDLRRILDVIRERKSLREMQRLVQEMQKGYKGK